VLFERSRFLVGLDPGVGNRGNVAFECGAVYKKLIFRRPVEWELDLVLLHKTINYFFCGCEIGILAAVGPTKRAPIQRHAILFRDKINSSSIYLELSSRGSCEFHIVFRSHGHHCFVVVNENTSVVGGSGGICGLEEETENPS